MILQTIDLNVVDFALACRVGLRSGDELLVEESESAFVGQRFSGW
jgi:hypothetical protein